MFCFNSTFYYSFGRQKILHYKVNKNLKMPVLTLEQRVKALVTSKLIHMCKPLHKLCLTFHQKLQPDQEVSRRRFSEIQKTVRTT